jgi:hypothetical protein
MLLNTLESLVLRNVNVANDRLTLEMLRHGPSYQTDSQTPEIPISQRHPSQGREQELMQPAKRFDDAVADGVGAVFGAGRSRRLAGVLSRRSAVLAAARVVPNERLCANGGAELPAAARVCRIPAERAATGGASNSGRLPTERTVSFITGNRDLPHAGYVNETRPTAGVAWCKPVTRTLPASTRGKGVR